MDSYSYSDEDLWMRHTPDQSHLSDSEWVPPNSLIIVITIFFWVNSISKLDVYDMTYKHKEMYRNIYIWENPCPLIKEWFKSMLVASHLGLIGLVNLLVIPTTGFLSQAITLHLQIMLISQLVIMNNPK